MVQPITKNHKTNYNAIVKIKKVCHCDPDVIETLLCFVIKSFSFGIITDELQHIQKCGIFLNIGIMALGLAISLFLFLYIFFN